MTDSKTLGRIPAWAWLFALTCFAIPIVSLGGAIPAALGIGGGMACLQMSRRVERRTRSRVLRVAMVTGSCWAGFLLLAVIVFSLAPKNSASAESSGANGSGPITPETMGMKTFDLADEELRRTVYRKAYWFRDGLERAEAKLKADRKAGRDTSFSEKRVEHMEKMNKDQRASVAERYGLSVVELEEVLREGKAKDWPLH